MASRPLFAFGLLGDLCWGGFLSKSDREARITVLYLQPQWLASGLNFCIYGLLELLRALLNEICQCHKSARRVIPQKRCVKMVLMDL
jgi:hypothetical protein